MDEPFGAVDPIVRARLQDELLTLQQRLHKTIVFVTHDIDEAIRLGDRMAVLNVGGVLEQYGPPADVLAAPTNDFVTRLPRRGARPEAPVADPGRRRPSSTWPGRVARRPRSADARAVIDRERTDWVAVVDDGRLPGLGRPRPTSDGGRGHRRRRGVGPTVRHPPPPRRPRSARRSTRWSARPPTSPWWSTRTTATSASSTSPASATGSSTVTVPCQPRRLPAIGSPRPTSRSSAGTGSATTSTLHLDRARAAPRAHVHRGRRRVRARLRCSPLIALRFRARLHPGQRRHRHHVRHPEPGPVRPARPDHRASRR